MTDVERRIDDVKGMIRKLRNITIFLQIAPFVYSSAYIVSFIIYMYGTTTAVKFCDMLLYVSPIVVALFLIASHMLGLCKWHKTACSVPLVPFAINMVDYYIVELTEVEAAIAVVINMSMALLLLVSAYHVFISPTRL